MYHYCHAGTKEERKHSSYTFLPSALDSCEWSASHPCLHFTPEERTHGTHWTAGWVGFRAGPDTEARGKTLCLCQESKPSCSVCSQTLCWLSYPSSTTISINVISYKEQGEDDSGLWCCVALYPHGVLTHKTTINMFTTERTSNRKKRKKSSNIHSPYWNRCYMCVTTRSSKNLLL
jgi:hypothetical protein